MWSFSNEILFIQSMCSTMDSSWRKSSPSLDFFFLARVPPNFPRKDSSFFILVDCRLADAPRLRDMFCVGQGGSAWSLSAHPSPWCIQGAEDNQTAKHKVTDTSQALKRQRWIITPESIFPLIHTSHSATYRPDGQNTSTLCFSKEDQFWSFWIGILWKCYRQMTSYLLQEIM